MKSIRHKQYHQFQQTLRTSVFREDRFRFYLDYANVESEV